MGTHLTLSNYYGQFALSMGQESSYISSDIPLIQRLSIVPSVSELMRCDYITLVILLIPAIFNLTLLIVEHLYFNVSPLD